VGSWDQTHLWHKLKPKPQNQNSSRGDTGASPLRPINQSEETQLELFSLVCLLHSILSIALCCHLPGQLRTTPAVAYQRIRENIEAQFMIASWLSFKKCEWQTFLSSSPIPICSTFHSAVNATRLALTAGHFAYYHSSWVEIAGANIEALESNPCATKGLPYALALMTILGIHEMGTPTARFYKIVRRCPTLSPCPFPGYVCKFIQMRSPVPNRSLFDLSIAGPLAGFVVTLPLLIWVYAFYCRSAACPARDVKPMPSILTIRS